MRGGYYDYEERRGHNGILYLFLFAVVVLLAMRLLSAANTMSLQFSMEHARSRHGQDADDVYRCYQQNGPLVSFWNAVTGRCAHVVKPDSQYGVIIEGEGDDAIVTAFKVGRDIAKIINYLMNRGYTIFAGP